MAVTKGIILAGGTGSRLFPMTLPVCKQLLPIYDKPMVYYPLSVLMLAGVREVLIISTQSDLPRFEALFGKGSQIGMSISYAAQDSPRGIAEAVLIGEEFLAGQPFFLILGDNFFYGQGFSDLLRKEAARSEGAAIFTYAVSNPSAYGVVETDEQGAPVALVEKPSEPKSDLAVTGLYRFDGRAAELTRRLQPSGHGELEITDLNRLYLEQGNLHIRRLGRGVAWMDAGTPDALIQAGAFVQTVEQRQGLKIGCLEEIAYLYGYIDRAQLRRLAQNLANTPYGSYLARLAEIRDPAIRRTPKPGDEM